MITRPTYNQRLLIKAEFDKLIALCRGNRLHARELKDNGYWGGYTRLHTWGGSCGNKEWVCLSNHNLPVCCPDGPSLAYWMLKMRKLYKKYRLGNLFYSYPTGNGDTPIRGYEIIHFATKVLKLPRITRSQNPNYGDGRFQDVYLLAGDIL